MLNLTRSSLEGYLEDNLFTGLTVYGNPEIHHIKDETYIVYRNAIAKMYRAQPWLKVSDKFIRVTLVISENFRKRNRKGTWCFFNNAKIYNTMTSNSLRRKVITNKLNFNALYIDSTNVFTDEYDIWWQS